ncbi:hypothetical protein E2C01_072099 [Portunus trituberculatus]|uniref:Uncharacterized protein n=1 Tax=Portunus trituberculatus TaxID=210409 RepID=A0A5B7HX49_PORTR|nr:hypothetical protein [Portunus trituberculatus]
MGVTHSLTISSRSQPHSANPHAPPLPPNHDLNLRATTPFCEP